jgi:hypothetical protein
MWHSHSFIKFSITMFIFIIFAFSPELLFAHHPIFTDDKATGPETAIQIKEPQISQVVYREITSDSPQIWLSFEAPKDFKLFVQIGVPVIDRLKDFRPTMVVVGPGLPDKDPPFKLPEKTGARVFTTKEVEKPRFFHEPFTNTDSWILRGETIPLHDAGRYYLVGFAPADEHGKLWLSVGQRESFSLKDFKDFPTWTEKIQAYHEVKAEQVPFWKSIGESFMEFFK